MTKEKWLKRYADRMITRTGMSVSFAREVAEAGAQAKNEEVDPDWTDPENDADEELSCWEKRSTML